MVYDIPFWWVAAACAVLCTTLSLPSVLAPKPFGAWARSLSRNSILGTVLMAFAVVCTLWLIRIVDLGEFSQHRTVMNFVVMALGALSCWLLRDFLLPRAVGLLLVLGCEVILSSAFPLTSLWRLPLTCIAYVAAVSGMVFVASPYRFRDLQDILHSSPSLTRITGLVGCAVGLLCAACGFLATA